VNTERIQQAEMVPVFGAHRSIAGGFENAFRTGLDVGCECLQLFVKNQRQWKAPPLTEGQVAAFRAGQRETGLWPIVAHASYLVNLGSPDTAMRTKSIDAMADELQRCEALGVSSLIFHPGAHRSGTLEAGVEQVTEALDEVHGRCGGFKTTILLETTAGQGTAIGYRFEQLAAILHGVTEAERLGVCLDTCHLFAAGYDFRTVDDYERLIDALSDVIGLPMVKCIHMNDSKRELGSRIDRHEHIGQGKIGKQGFAHFVNDVRWSGIPMIIETPKGKDGRGTDLDKVNLNRLRALIV
jgi:deoxyribonuclease-4